MGQALELRAAFQAPEHWLGSELSTPLSCCWSQPASQPWGMEIWCQCFAVRVINRWNDFPRAVVDSSSLQFFKSGSAVKIIWGQFLACVRQEVTVVPPGLGIAQSVEADMLPELSPGTDPDMTAYSWLGGGGSSVACVPG